MTNGQIIKIIRSHIVGYVNVNPVKDGVQFTKNCRLFLITNSLDCYEISEGIRCMTKRSEGLQSYIKNFIN